MRRPSFTLAVVLAAGLMPGPALSQQGESAAEGVYADSIVFGQSAALEGPAGELGRNMHLGIRAAFEEANREGGVHGRALRLIVRDDGYEPEPAVANTQELIEHGVFGLIGAVGTPTSSAAEPGASDAGVPYIGAFTGAGLLRRPDQRYVVNLRASYGQETEEMVERLVRDLGFEPIPIDRIGLIADEDRPSVPLRAARERRELLFAKTLLPLPRSVSFGTETGLQLQALRERRRGTR
jgi:ABC-type branched-subunit amino acid transport system substrate-binding protein